MIPPSILAQYDRRPTLPHAHSDVGPVRRPAAPTYLGVSPHRPTQGSYVRPQGGLFPSLCALGTRSNRVLLNPERDGGRRLNERPGEPHWSTLPPAIEQPAREAMRRRLSSLPTPVARYVSGIAQNGVDYTLGALACLQAAGLVCTGRRRRASVVMHDHGGQVLIFVGTTLVGVTIGSVYTLLFAIGA